MEAVVPVRVGRCFSLASRFSHVHIIGALVFRKGRHIYLDNY
jgi:hypothetical protein